MTKINQKVLAKLVGKAIAHQRQLRGLTQEAVAETVRDRDRSGIADGAWGRGPHHCAIG